jgi:hypothetical protein
MKKLNWNIVGGSIYEINFLKAILGGYSYCNFSREES